MWGVCDIFHCGVLTQQHVHSLLRGSNDVDVATVLPSPHPDVQPYLLPRPSSLPFASEVLEFAPMTVHGRSASAPFTSSKENSDTLQR
jgi:hypothetical protein